MAIRMKIRAYAESYPILPSYMPMLIGQGHKKMKWSGPDGRKFGKCPNSPAKLTGGDILENQSGVVVAWVPLVWARI